MFLIRNCRTLCHGLGWLTLAVLCLAAATAMAALPLPAPGRTFSFQLDAQGRLDLDSARLVHSGHFGPGTDWQTVTFAMPVRCQFFCLDALSS
ncbi:MAG TPA: hypothetical protein VF988_16010, partial [Verrucomicrobiae bacterium]